MVYRYLSGLANSVEKENGLCYAEGQNLKVNLLNPIILSVRAAENYIILINLAIGQSIKFSFGPLAQAG